MLGEECESHCKNDNRLLASLGPFTFKDMRETAIEINKAEDKAILRGGKVNYFVPFLGGRDDIVGACGGAYQGSGKAIAGSLSPYLAPY